MISGIYQAASGMDSLVRIQEGIANNLANINTNGFRKELMQVIQNDSTHLQVNRMVSTNPGVPKMTENPFHLALGCEGYFTVDTGSGMAYTRNGDFSMDKEGRLLTTEGHLLQGQKGPIVLDKNEFTVTESGEIIIQGEVADQLLISNGSGPLRRLGNSLMVFEDPTSVTMVNAEDVNVMQGMLEGSNVNVMESMTDMMMVSRLFEANQKAMESQDAALKQLITEVGRGK